MVAEDRAQDRWRSRGRDPGQELLMPLMLMMLMLMLMPLMPLMPLMLMLIRC